MTLHLRFIKTMTLVLLFSLEVLALCPRPKDFSNREEALKYDACVMRENYRRPLLDPKYFDKTSCLHDKKDVVACRKKELRGESIKPVEVKIFGASPTPAPKLNPTDGEIPVEDSKKEADKPKDPTGTF